MHTQGIFDFKKYANRIIHTARKEEMQQCADEKSTISGYRLEIQLKMQTKKAQEARKPRRKNNMKLSEKNVEKLRVILLEITPEITGVVEELANIHKMRLSVDDASDEEAFSRGIDVAKEVMDMLLVRQYDSIMKIIAALNEMKLKELKEKTVGEVTKMVFDALSDEVLMSFFPRSRLLARRTPSAILPM